MGGFGFGGFGEGEGGEAGFEFGGLCEFGSLGLGLGGCGFGGGRVFFGFGFLVVVVIWFFSNHDWFGCGGVLFCECGVWVGFGFRLWNGVL